MFCLESPGLASVKLDIQRYKCNFEILYTHDWLALILLALSVWSLILVVLYLHKIYHIYMDLCYHF